MASNSEGFSYGDHFQTGQHSLLGGMYPTLGELPPVPETTGQQTKFYGNSQLSLVLRQAPIHARVALGKEKG